MLYWRWTHLFARDCEEDALLHLPAIPFFSTLTWTNGNPTHYQTAPAHSTAHDLPCEDVFQQDSVERHHGFFWSKAGSQHGLQAAAKTWLGFQENIDKEWKHVAKTSNSQDATKHELSEDKKITPHWEEAFRERSLAAHSWQEICWHHSAEMVLSAIAAREIHLSAPRAFACPRPTLK